MVGIDLSEKPLDAFENSVLLSILGEGALALSLIHIYWPGFNKKCFRNGLLHELFR